jgi:orotate phosphoribosyltransferase
MVCATGAVEIRDVPLHVTNIEVDQLSRNRQPFKYSSGNWGPGYLMIKGLVGWPTVLKCLIKYLAFEVAERVPDLQFVAGNATGGMIPGWQLAGELSGLLGREIPCAYIRETRKAGGQKELITGIANNPKVPAGAIGINVEELTNFAETITNGVSIMRNSGYTANHGAAIFYYENPEANKKLAENKIEMIHLFTLPELLDVAESNSLFPVKAVTDYRKFLADPSVWQAERGLTKVEKGGT